MSNKKTNEVKEEIVLKLWTENKGEPRKTTFEETIKIEYSLMQLIQDIKNKEKSVEDKKAEIEGNKKLIKLEEKSIGELQRRMEHPDVVKILKDLEEIESKMVKEEVINVADLETDEEK